MKMTEIPAESLEKQREYIGLVKKMSSAQPQKPLAFVDTYGCQQNEADSEKIRGMLDAMGYAFTDSEREADVIVINTCAVREHAEMRILGNVGALTHTKRAKPSQIIALCGCMVQEPGMADRIRRSFPYVDIVFGPHVLWRFPEFLHRRLEVKKRIFSADPDDGALCEGLPTYRQGGVKAWLPVMYGCNNFCSYCIVPYVRGRERSRRPDMIIKDAEALVRDGVKDITLLGQNVNSYGLGLDEQTDFPDLIRRVNDIDGEFLIRFMTSHPKDAGERLFAAMAECEKAAHHIHLPFQSGSSRILKAMNRRYTREDYMGLIECARRHMPDIVITSDVIVGFPGETDEDFEETLSLVEQIRFDSLFTFIYSPRVGTPAASMPDPYPREQKQVRFDRLVTLQNRISTEKHADAVGRVFRVLADGVAPSGDGLLTSRTNGGRLVHFRGDESIIGSFVNVKITDSSTWSLAGELV